MLDPAVGSFGVSEAVGNCSVPAGASGIGEDGDFVRGADISGLGSLPAGSYS